MIDTATAPIYRDLPQRPRPRHQAYVIPERTQLQRSEALLEANRIRMLRAALKKDLKEGRAKTYDYLIAPPEFIHTMKVWDLVFATPKVGRTKTNKMLTEARISPSKTVGGMTERQRHELATYLKHY